jgi:hypothetical protein
MRLGMSHTVAKTFCLSTLLSSFSFCSNRLRDFTNVFQGHLKSCVSAQYTLEKGKVFRVPLSCQQLHVLSGIAWLTVAGEDIILITGEKVSLDSHQGCAILSVLGEVPLILEIL